MNGGVSRRENDFDEKTVRYPRLVNNMRLPRPCYLINCIRASVKQDRVARHAFFEFHSPLAPKQNEIEAVGPGKLIFRLLDPNNSLGTKGSHFVTRSRDKIPNTCLCNKTQWVDDANARLSISIFVSKPHTAVFPNSHSQRRQVFARLRRLFPAPVIEIDPVAHDFDGS